MTDDDMIEGAVERGYLDGFCDYQGLAADKPLGILNTPPGVGVVKYPGIEYSLTYKDESGWLMVDEDLISRIEAQWGPLKFRGANGGGPMTRAEFREKFGKDPIWVLAWMRLHAGVETHPVEGAGTLRQKRGG